MRLDIPLVPPQSPAEATARLCQLAFSAHENPGKLQKLGPRSVFELTMCLSTGADPNATIDIPETDNPYGPQKNIRILDIMLTYPLAALRLVEHGALIEQGTVKQLAAAAAMNAVIDRDTDINSYLELTLLCASKFPELNWYEDVKVPVGLFYSYWPANMVIEQRAVGFNEILERSQAMQGLPVGYQVSDLKTRQEIIRDLATIEPCLIWAGGRPRVEILRQMMRDDVSANLVAERANSDAPVLLLEYFLVNHADPDIIKELLERGATVGSIDFLSTTTSIAVLDPHKEEETRDAVLSLLLQHASFGLEDQWPDNYGDGQTVRQFLHLRAPQFLAQYERASLDRSTSKSVFSPRATRL